MLFLKMTIHGLTDFILSLSPNHCSFKHGPSVIYVKSPNISLRVPVR